MEDALTVIDGMSVAITPSAPAALDAAEEQMQIRARKRAAARMAMDVARREYMQRLEDERLKTVIEVLKARVGRPETIPDETMQLIIELHANGEPLKPSCEAMGISRSAFYRRVEASEELRASLARARESCAHAKVDDTWAIARTEPDVERARLLSEIARWEVSKVLPHLYGDKLAVQAPDGVVFSLNIGQLVEKKEGST